MRGHQIILAILVCFVSGQQLTITNPITSQTWEKNVEVTIFWHNSGYDPNLNISILLSNTQDTVTVGSAIIADNTTSFLVPSTLYDNSQYKLYLYSETTNFIEGPLITISNGLLTFLSEKKQLPTTATPNIKNIVITSPLSKTEWSIGSIVTVTWTDTGVSTKMTILLYSVIYGPAFLANADSKALSSKFRVPNLKIDSWYQLHIYAEGYGYIDGPGITIVSYVDNYYSAESTIQKRL
ncbi:hypothetical protein HK096_009159 [Nowakowskiella sp. JEL0078]|nr:hypothetical protein HK096_009159 [Nowakowskiella sp. JEL0078]